MGDTPPQPPPPPSGETAAENNYLPSADSDTTTTTTATAPKWPGWPGDNVFRLIVPVVKVGSIIGRKGEFIKKMCEETRARIRVLEAPIGTPDRVVFISGKEEPDAPLSPAMDAAVRIFKRVSGVGEGNDKGSVADASAFCSMRFLVASPQATNLIGKQGATIKAIQESSGAVVKILSEGELPSYASSDERIVEIHGEAFKVQKALEAVLGQLRKFLHDHSVVAVFEKTYNANISQDRTADVTQSLAQNTSTQTLIGIGADSSLPLKRESYFEREAKLDLKFSRSAVSLYGPDPALGSVHSMTISRAAAPIQVTQTMQIPLSYAEDIIGIAGRNIAYIRRASGAILSVQESQGQGQGHEITVEIKGTATQVQTAQQLIQESINGQEAKAKATASIYGKNDLGLGVASYSRLPDSTYSSLSSLSAYSSEGFGGGYASGLGSYSSYRF